MRYETVCIEAFGYELPPNVVSSAALEGRLAPLYKELRIQPGQLEALTGIRERRYWDKGTTMAEGATRAGLKALAASRVAVEDIGVLIYGGVCRDHLEPANACAIAHGLGLSPKTQLLDVSNACLGVINGMVLIANAIELGQVRAGMVAACETARQIVDVSIEKMLRHRDMETFRLSLATLTGGSGAVAVVLTHADLAPAGHGLLSGVARCRPAFHDLCKWGPATGVPAQVEPGTMPMDMTTDAAAVMEHGIELGEETWFAFLEETGWTNEQIDRTICHQVGAPHRSSVLRKIGIPVEKDFQTFEFLGNMGTVSLPLTAAIAEQRGVLRKGHRVAMCGIGSGLNCMILGVDW